MIAVFCLARAQRAAKCADESSAVAAPFCVACPDILIYNPDKIKMFFAQPVCSCCWTTLLIQGQCLQRCPMMPPATGPLDRVISLPMVTFY
jgi:hypothetical protein